ncbi:ABC transporter substrate-binding protein [Azospirillum thermophilum]|uniref:Branched-chain amino acid ABC transporter substrate-binding protein n=1 Tax=Azospirillum thermophilum TaxID=2202148 RepID=A0A2S2CK17_9PROT|nr:ABC transporter substrate-binding protein [Azospirillum thermophilum]AWK84848.1 branched-chain amino acid ABC transporter substrate-binding protein [Azospirillum thermophilum]
MKRTLTQLAATVALGVALGASSLAQAKEFLLGSELPLTGNLARVGQGMHEGIAVAIEMANRAYAGKHSFKVSTIDDETNPAKAVAAVERLIGDGAVALTGGYGSNIIGPASEAAQKAGVVYITSGGVTPELTARGYPTFFRINNSEGYAKAMIGLLEDMGVKKVSVVYLNKDATTNLAKQVQSALSAKGVTVGMHEFDAATSDFKPLLNKVKLQDRSEAIAMVGYENDYVGILRAAKVLKPQVKAVVGVWSLATAQMAKEFPDLMENVYGTSMLPYPVEFTQPEALEFAAEYKKLFNKEPDYLGQFGYVQTRLLIDAIVRAEEAGTLAKGGLADELRRTDAQTLIGRVTFDAKGDNTNFSHRMGQHQTGKVVLVWPKDAANGAMRFPGVPW